MSIELWKGFLWSTFVLGPPVLILWNSLVFRYLCRYHLGKMLFALKTSSRFSSEYSRGISHLGFLSRASLLLAIGYALVWPQRKIAKGQLDKREVNIFPKRLKFLARVSFFGFVLNGLWVIAWIATLPLDKPLLASKIFNEIISLPFLFHIGPFILFAISHGVVVYMTRYHLPILIDAIGLSHGYRSEHAIALERIIFRGRSQFIIRLGMAVFFKGRRMGRLNLDCFELEILPALLKRLALINALFLYIGFVWLIVSVVIIKWGGT